MSDLPGDQDQGRAPAVPEDPESQAGGPRPVSDGSDADTGPDTEPAEAVDAGPDGGADAAEQAGEDQIEQDEEPDWDTLAAEDPRSPGELLAELRAAEEARDDYLEALQRARAEFDNYRKRMMRETTTQREAGRAEVAEALLDVLDDFDRTLEAADDSEDEDGLARGIELVYGKLVDALKGLGLARIDAEGVAFDPNRHEAVQRRDTDEDLDAPVVDEILRPGYELSDRVIRAAMVAVKQ